jgi:hypothetical protein
MTACCSDRHSTMLTSSPPLLSIVVKLATMPQSLTVTLSAVAGQMPCAARLVEQAEGGVMRCGAIRRVAGGWGPRTLGHKSRDVPFTVGGISTGEVATISCRPLQCEWGHCTVHTVCVSVLLQKRPMLCVLHGRALSGTAYAPRCHLTVKEWICTVCSYDSDRSLPVASCHTLGLPWRLSA